MQEQAGNVRTMIYAHACMCARTPLGKKDDEIADLLEDWFACAGDWAHSRTFQRLTNRKKRRHRVKYAYKTKLQLMDMSGTYISLFAHVQSLWITWT